MNCLEMRRGVVAQSRNSRTWFTNASVSVWGGSVWGRCQGGAVLFVCDSKTELTPCCGVSLPGSVRTRRAVPAWRPLVGLIRSLSAF